MHEKKRVLVIGMTEVRGGTEAVVDNYVSALAGEVLFDFLMHANPPCRSFNAFGNRTFIIPQKSSNPIAYKREFKRFFSEHGEEYSAVWLNLNNLSNIDGLKFARKCGIAKRIVHAHNSRWLANPLQLKLSEMHKRSIGQYATDLWACSHPAGELFFGSSDFIVIPNAFEIEDYAFSEAGRNRVRRELGLGGSLVIGAVGRLEDQKNHLFLVDVIPEIMKLRPDAKIVIIGEGSLREAIAKRAKSLGVSGNLVMPGSRRDIADCLSAFDVYAMPSLFEGLPVSLLEARANGLPCLIADSVSSSAVTSELTIRIPLSKPDLWAQAFCSKEIGRCNPFAGELSFYDINVQKHRLLAAFGEG